MQADVFFNELEENGVSFGPNEEAQARDEHSTHKGSDFIKYEKALSCFWYLRDQSEWVYNPQSTRARSLSKKGLWSLNRAQDQVP